MTAASINRQSIDLELTVIWSVGRSLLSYKNGLVQTRDRSVCRITCPAIELGMVLFYFLGGGKWRKLFKEARKLFKEAMTTVL